MLKKIRLAPRPVGKKVIMGVEAPSALQVPFQHPEEWCIPSPQVRAGEVRMAPVHEYYQLVHCNGS